MQVDFYQLTRDPAEKILPALAAKLLGEDARLLVVSNDAKQLTDVSAALWTQKADSFLAHAIADGGQGDAAQPILLSNAADATNGAKNIALADGVWRDEALGFDRAFYLFPPERTDDARAAWRALGDNEGVERRYWRQDGGKWVQGP
jgi:DNA polymerase III subunit chi